MRILFGLIISFSLSLNAQNLNSPLLDSLNNLYNSAQEDTTKLALRVQIGQNSYVFRVGYWDSIVVEARRLKMIKDEGVALNNLCVIHRNNGNYPKALESMHASLKIKEEMGDSVGIGMALNGLSLLYDEMGDSVLALDLALQSLEIRTKLGRKNELAVSLNNIGGIYKSHKDFENALEYMLRAKSLYEEINDLYSLGQVCGNIGVLYFDFDSIIQAESYLKLGLQYSKENNNIGAAAHSLTFLGEIELKKGNLIEAQKYGEEAYEIASNLGHPNKIKMVARLLTNVYKSQGKFKDALFMSDLYIQMRDSINNINFKRESLKKQMQFEYEKQALADSVEFAKQEELMSAELKQERTQRWAFMAGGLLALVLAIVAFISFVNKRKDNRLIAAQKKMVEQQKELVEEKNHEILDSINYAKRIQSAILPPDKIVKEYLKNSFILYKPKDIVAGDFYWMEHKDGKVLFAAADCTGHGVPGAMVSVVCNNALNRSVREYGLTEPGKILDKAREIVLEEFEKSDEEVKDGMDIALCALKGNILEYAGANNPLWIVRNSEIYETKADKQPVGKFDNPQPYTNNIIELQPGDIFYIFSDGFVDQFGGEKGKKFKAKAFRELLLQIQDKPMNDQKLLIDERFENWKGKLEQIDDICIIGVKL